MDFRIPSSRSFTVRVSAPEGDTSIKQGLKTRADNRPKTAPAENAAEVAAANLTPGGRVLGDSNAQEFVRIASEAAGAVADLRQQQLDLASEAAAISDPERQSQLNSTYSTLQTEIGRIQSSATYQGSSVLSGKTLAMEDKTVAVANLTSIVSDPGASLSSQSSALTAVSTLGRSVLSANFASSGAEAASSKARADTPAVVTEIESPQALSEDGLRNIAEAQKLADNIAQALRNAAQQDKPEETIFANDLQPERVSQLLE